MRRALFLLALLPFAANAKQPPADVLPDLSHERVGCWYLAAAAYDSGENRVARIMKKRLRREKGRDRDYYRIWDDIPGETRDYVPAIIALKRIGKEPGKYGF